MTPLYVPRWALKLIPERQCERLNIVSYPDPDEGYVETWRQRLYWRVYNGFEIRVGECFFWLNFVGVGVGRLDHEGLGRGQWVRYW